MYIYKNVCALDIEGSRVIASRNLVVAYSHIYIYIYD